MSSDQKFSTLTADGRFKTITGGSVNLGPCRVTYIQAHGGTNCLVKLHDGTDADPDGFVDGISPNVASTGFKGFFPCNGVLGMSGGATTASTETADEVEAVVSGDPGASGVTMVLKFIGISSSSDAS